MGESSSKNADRDVRFARQEQGKSYGVTKSWLLAAIMDDRIFSTNADRDVRFAWQEQRKTHKVTKSWLLAAIMDDRSDKPAIMDDRQGWAAGDNPAPHTPRAATPIRPRSRPRRRRSRGSARAR